MEPHVRSNVASERLEGFMCLQLPAGSPSSDPQEDVCVCGGSVKRLIFIFASAAERRDV